MKTYCKRKDISNIDFVKSCITPFLHERLDKSNVAKLFAYYNGILLCSEGTRNICIRQ